MIFACNLKFPSSERSNYFIFDFNINVTEFKTKRSYLF